MLGNHLDRLQDYGQSDHLRSSRSPDNRHDDCYYRDGTTDKLLPAHFQLEETTFAQEGLDGHRNNNHASAVHGRNGSCDGHLGLDTLTARTSRLTQVG